MHLTTDIKNNYSTFLVKPSCDQFSPSSSFQTACPSSYSCISTKGVFEGVTVETRECGQGKGRGGCITRQMGGGARATICSCNQDNCNGGVVQVEAFEEAEFIDLVWAMTGLLV